MSAAGDPRPCGGDAFKPMFALAALACDRCSAYHRNMRLMRPLPVKCPGPDGYAFFLPVAVEVAGERKTGPSATGGTVTDITWYPAGTDPRLVLEDVTGWWEFP